MNVKITSLILLFAKPSADGAAESLGNLAPGTVVEVTGDPRTITSRGQNASEFSFLPVRALGKEGFVLANHTIPSTEKATAPPVDRSEDLLEALQDLRDDLADVKSVVKGVSGAAAGNHSILLEAIGKLDAKIPAPPKA